MRRTSWWDDLIWEARDWRVSRGAALAFLIVPIAGGITILATRAHKPLFKALTGEGRVLETLQFVDYLAAGVAAAAVAVWLYRRHLLGPTTLWGLFAIGCLLVAGEEIAWGQAYFNWETPEILEEINEQAETTVHNIGPVQNATSVVLLALGLYGVASPVIYRRWVGERPQGLARLFVPPLFLVSAFLVVFGYKLTRLTVLTSDRFTVVESGEWAEFCLSAALAGFSVLTLGWLRAEQPALARASRQRLPVTPSDPARDTSRITPDPTTKLNKEV